jgi:uncharacterized protein (TIGR04222 family)
MTPNRTALLDQIEAFDIDGPDAPALPFAARLARENGWSRPYADRVIREYKRYVFLSATSEVPVCPSEDVDAAWHLHLTYTRSYWKRFCGEILGRPLHHDPTKGGPAEAEKHLRMYARTLAAYREAFGEEPPSEIWPTAEVRFGDDLKHRMVNTARNWVVPKLPVKRVFQATAAFLALAIFVPGCEGGINPFDLVGAEFLYFLIPMMIAAMCIGRVIRSSTRKPNPYPGDDTLDLDWQQIAFLAGGYPRLTTAAIARLVASGGLEVHGDSLTTGEPNWQLTPVEEAVRSCSPIAKSNLKPVQEAVEAAFASRATQMEQDGFLVPKSRQVGVGCASLVPLFLVILFLAVPRLLMGLANNKPVFYLIMTCIFGTIIGIGVIRNLKLRLTRRGENLLVWQRAKHAPLKDGSGDIALGVALFGTAVLTGSSIAHLQAWYPRQTISSSGGCGSGCGTSSGCSGGDGGGGGGGGDGGGGGGCGGCGGGGGD